MNDPFFHQQAERLASRLVGLNNDEVRIDRLYADLFQREPTVTEQQRAMAFIRHYPGEHPAAWASLSRVLLSSNEFLHLD
jgi:hypothetical protein